MEILVNQNNHLPYQDMNLIQFQRLAILAQDIFITRLVHRPVVDSTNNLAIELSKDDNPDGLVVIADKQTGGRGRRGNEWCSPEGNLYMSVVFSPSLRVSNNIVENSLIQLITLMSGVAIVDAVDNLTGIKVSLKWPNDLIIEDKKVGGILTESRYHASSIKYLVIGIGINITDRAFPPSIVNRAISLSQFTNNTISRDELVFEILKSLDKWYRIFKEQEVDEIKGKIINQWKNYNCTIGRRVRVISDVRTITGTAIDIANSGDLIVQAEDGNVFSITSGSLEFL